jgi:photosystem II stability/assembly factor-like uncharacterized protein
MKETSTINQKHVRLIFNLLLVSSMFYGVTFATAQTLVNNYNDRVLSSEDLISRELYIYTRRAGGPGMVIQQDAYSKAVYQRSLLPQDKNIQSSPTSTVSWVSVNPMGMFYARTNNNYVSGRTNSIAFHPSNPNVMYIGAAQGGVWKTTDGGVTWQALTDNLSTLSSGDIAVDPSNPNVLYYGTGEMNFSLDSHYGNGIFQSTDAGASWLQVANTSVGSYISKIIVDPSNSNNIYSAGNGGVYKSTNAGLNWSTTSSPGGCTMMVMDPTNSQIIYISTGSYYSGSIMKTTNSGLNWNTATTGLPGSMGRITIAISNNNALVLFASIATSGGSLLGLYRTTDGANSWTLQASSPNYLGSQGWYDNGCCIKTGDPNTVITGGLDLYVSTNGGTTLVQKSQWASTSSTNFTHADIHYLKYNGTVLYCCSDGGVYKSTDDGNSWTDLNHYLSTLQYESADYDPSNLLKMYGGCQDNDKEATTDGGNNWIQRTTGDGGYTIVDPVNTNYVYGQYVNGSLERSPNYGISYSEIRPSGSSGGLFYNPYEMAQGDHNTIVFGRLDVWETNNAQTCSQTSGWTQIAATGVVGGNVSAIGISAQTINKIFIGTSNGRILVTTNNGSTWAALSGFSYVTDLAVDINNDNVCYATFGGTTATRIEKTTDGGATWNNISSGLPNIAVNTVVLRTNTPRMIFIGTDLGVYQSTNEGADWVSFNNGLPTMQVYDLKYKEGPAVLLAATHGRGCWTFNLGQTLGIKPVSETVVNFELEQNYPNPFNPETKITFSLPEPNNVRLLIFDILGNEVTSLINERLRAGKYEINWNASSFASGIYFYRITTDKFTSTKKMLLVK